MEMQDTVRFSQAVRPAGNSDKIVVLYPYLFVFIFVLSSLPNAAAGALCWVIEMACVPHAMKRQNVHFEDAAAGVCVHCACLIRPNGYRKS